MVIYLLDELELRLFPDHPHGLGMRVGKPCSFNIASLFLEEDMGPTGSCMK